MFYKNDKASSVPGFFMSGGGAASLLALVCAVLPAQSVAQNFPNKPMKLIVTSSPGGRFSRRWSKSWVGRRRSNWLPSAAI